MLRGLYVRSTRMSSRAQVIDYSTHVHEYFVTYTMIRCILRLSKGWLHRPRHVRPPALKYRSTTRQCVKQTTSALVAVLMETYKRKSHTGQRMRSATTMVEDAIL